MKPPHVGFYVHYHGLGHQQRTEAIIQRLTVRSSVITSRLDTSRWSTADDLVEIACDIDEVSENGRCYAGDVPALHYAPLWTDNVTRRVSQFTAWLDRERPDLMVVDVSAEISMLTRLAAIPQLVMRQHGDRRDEAHRNAYAAAHSLVAPFPESMEDSITPHWIREKTVYLHGFHRSPRRRFRPILYDRPTIVCLFGRGGTDNNAARLVEAATAVADVDWLVVGKPKPPELSCPDNLRYAGWVDSPHSYTTNAEIVVTAAGHNSVMELGLDRKRMIAIAEPRPFDEQLRKVSVLDREGLAVGLPRWPEAQQWASLMRQAAELDLTKWESVFRQDGAEQAARHITEVLDWSVSQRAESSPMHPKGSCTGQPTGVGVER